MSSMKVVFKIVDDNLKSQAVHAIDLSAWLADDWSLERPDPKKDEPKAVEPSNKDLIIAELEKLQAEGVDVKFKKSQSEKALQAILVDAVKE